MLKELKEFATDYNEMVLKPSGEWRKKHWKGYSVLCAATFVISGAATLAYIKIKEKKESEQYIKNLNAMYHFKKD